MTEALRYKIAISAAPERVWQALTTPEGSRATLYGSTIESSFEVGSLVEYVGYGEDGGRTVFVYGQVESFEPLRRFGYIQHPGAVHNPRHAETSCRMTFALTPSGGETELELTVDQWSEGNPAYEHARASYPESDFMNAIKAFAESGSE